MNASSCVIACLSWASNDLPRTERTSLHSPDKNTRTPLRRNLRSKRVPAETSSERPQYGRAAELSLRRFRTIHRELPVPRFRNKPGPDRHRDRTGHSTGACGLRRGIADPPAHHAVHHRTSECRKRKGSPRITRIKERATGKTENLPVRAFDGIFAFYAGDLE